MALMKIMNELVLGSDLELFRNANCCVSNTHTSELWMCTKKDNLFVMFALFYHLCHYFNVCPYTLSLGLTLAISVMSQFLQWDKLIKDREPKRKKSYGVKWKYLSVIVLSHRIYFTYLVPESNHTRQTRILFQETPKCSKH